MTEHETQPDNAGNKGREGAIRCDGYSTTRTAQTPPQREICPSRDGVWEVSTGDPTFEPTQRVSVNGYVFEPVGVSANLTIKLADVEEERDRLAARLAAVERNAELLHVARHDLLVEVDQTTARLREAHGDIPFGSVKVEASHVEQAEKLLDRLAAYMKGQDERIVAVGDQRDHARTERDAVISDLLAIESRERYWRSRDEEARALVDDARPSVRLVNDWATWSDASLYAYADAHIARADLIRGTPSAPASRNLLFAALAEIRRVARDRLGDDGFTIPPAYGDVEREAASTALRRIASRGDVADANSYAGTSTDGERYGATVDTIARTLGMRRAGA